MDANTSGNEGRGPIRGKKTHWWIVIVIAIAAGVALVLYFSIPIFLSPGGGIGTPTNTEEQQQQPPPLTVRGTAAGKLSNDLLIGE